MYRPNIGHLGSSAEEADLEKVRKLLMDHKRATNDDSNDKNNMETDAYLCLLLMSSL